MTRPLKLRGLGIHDLQVMAWALRMRWLWLKKTNPNRPWALLNINVPAQARAMFAISVTTTVGDVCSTNFWTDRWVHGKSLAEMAPA